MTKRIKAQRLRVLRGEIPKTSGGLTAKDLFPDGTSKKASMAAKKRPNPIIDLFATKKGEFQLQPRVGTYRYKKIMKKK